VRDPLCFLQGFLRFQSEPVHLHMQLTSSSWDESVKDSRGWKGAPPITRHPLPA